MPDTADNIEEEFTEFAMSNAAHEASESKKEASDELKK